MEDDHNNECPSCKAKFNSATDLNVHKILLCPNRDKDVAEEHPIVVKARERQGSKTGSAILKTCQDSVRRRKDLAASGTKMAKGKSADKTNRKDADAGASPGASTSKASAPTQEALETQEDTSPMEVEEIIILDEVKKEPGEDDWEPGLTLSETDEIDIHVNESFEVDNTSGNAARRTRAARRRSSENLQDQTDLNSTLDENTERTPEPQPGPSGLSARAQGLVLFETETSPEERAERSEIIKRRARDWAFDGGSPGGRIDSLLMGGPFMDDSGDAEVSEDEIRNLVVREDYRKHFGILIPLDFDHVKIKNDPGGEQWHKIICPFCPWSIKRHKGILSHISVHLGDFWEVFQETFLQPTQRNFFLQQPGDRSIKNRHRYYAPGSMIRCPFHAVDGCSQVWLKSSSGMSDHLLQNHGIIRKILSWKNFICRRTHFEPLLRKFDYNRGFFGPGPQGVDEPKYLDNVVIYKNGKKIVPKTFAEYCKLTEQDDDPDNGPALSLEYGKWMEFAKLMTAVTRNTILIKVRLSDSFPLLAEPCFTQIHSSTFNMDNYVTQVSLQAEEIDRVYQIFPNVDQEPLDDDIQGEEQATDCKCRCKNCNEKMNCFCPKCSPSKTCRTFVPEDAAQELENLNLATQDSSQKQEKPSSSTSADDNQKPKDRGQADGDDGGNSSKDMEIPNIPGFRLPDDARERIKKSGEGGTFVKYVKETIDYISQNMNLPQRELEVEALSRALLADINRPDATTLPTMNLILQDHLRRRTEGWFAELMVRLLENDAFGNLIRRMDEKFTNLHRNFLIGDLNTRSLFQYNRSIKQKLREQENKIGELKERVSQIDIVNAEGEPQKRMKINEVYNEITNTADDLKSKFEGMESSSRVFNQNMIRANNDMGVKEKKAIEKINQEADLAAADIGEYTRQSLASIQDETKKQLAVMKDKRNKTSPLVNQIESQRRKLEKAINDGIEQETQLAQASGSAGQSVLKIAESQQAAITEIRNAVEAARERIKEDGQTQEAKLAEKVDAMLAAQLQLREARAGISAVEGITGPVEQMELDGTQRSNQAEINILDEAERSDRLHAHLDRRLSSEAHSSRTELQMLARNEHKGLFDNYSKGKSKSKAPPKPPRATRAIAESDSDDDDNNKGTSGDWKFELLQELKKRQREFEELKMINEGLSGLSGAVGPTTKDLVEKIKRLKAAQQKATLKMRKQSRDGAKNERKLRQENERLRKMLRREHPDEHRPQEYYASPETRSPRTLAGEQRYTPTTPVASDASIILDDEPLPYISLNRSPERRVFTDTPRSPDVIPIRSPRHRSPVIPTSPVRSVVVEPIDQWSEAHSEDEAGGTKEFDGRRCRKCKRIGHIQRNCPDFKRNRDTSEYRRPEVKSEVTIPKRKGRTIPLEERFDSAARRFIQSGRLAPADVNDEVPDLRNCLDQKREGAENRAKESSSRGGSSKEGNRKDEKKARDHRRDKSRSRSPRQPKK